MERPKRKLTCPKCGEEMNHHADKLVYPVAPSDWGQWDPGLDGVIEETHACPGCGAMESRRPT